jgi:hypothetical protein
MRINKKLLFLALGVLAMAVVVGYLAIRLSAPPLRIDWESVRLIQNGMTQAEVENLMGRPFRASEDGCAWQDGNLIVMVQFNEGKVSTIVLSRERDHSILAMFRRWLGI